MLAQNGGGLFPIYLRKVFCVLPIFLFSRLPVRPIRS